MFVLYHTKTVQLCRSGSRRASRHLADRNSPQRSRGVSRRQSSATTVLWPRSDKPLSSTVSPPLRMVTVAYRTCFLCIVMRPHVVEGKVYSIGVIGGSVRQPLEPFLAIPTMLHHSRTARSGRLADDHVGDGTRTPIKDSLFRLAALQRRPCPCPASSSTPANLPCSFVHSHILYEELVFTQLLACAVGVCISTAWLMPSYLPG